MAGRLIGDAYIVIYPQVDPATFRAQAEAGVKKALAGARPNIPVGAQIDPAEAAKLRAQLDALLKNENVNVGARIDPADAAKLRAQIEALTKTSPVRLETGGAVASLEDMAVRTDAVRDALANLRANVNDTAAEAQLAALEVKAAALDKAIGKAGEDGDADWAPLEARLLRIEAGFEKINAQKVNLDDAPMLAALTGLADRAGSLRAQLQNFRATLDDTAMEAKIAALEAQAAKLSRSLTFAPGDADLAPFEAGLLRITAAYDKLRAAQAEEDKETVTQTTFWNKLGLAGAGSLTNLREVVNAATAAGGGIKLFAGAIDALYAKVSNGGTLPSLIEHFIALASPIHLAIESVIEFTAIWAPALIALSAFSAAATPTVIAIGKQLQNMNTAAQGTGKSFQSLALKGQSLVAAVQPTVLEAFGIGLYAIQNHASDLADVMHSLGQGLDQFAAKAAIAFDASTTGKLFKQGSDDVLALFQSFQDLGSIMGTLFKVVPGYAEILLSVGNAALGFASDITKAIEPALAEFLKLHGALLYGGLLGTAASWVFSKIVAGATTVVEAIAGMATKWLAQDSIIIEGLGKVLLGLDALGSTPVLLGIGLVVGAIAAVSIYLKASSNAAKEFSKTIESALSATTVTALPQTLATDLAEANAKVTSSQQSLTAALKTSSAAAAPYVTNVGKVNSVMRNIPPALQDAASSAETYNEVQQQLSQQSKNLNLNLGAIAATYGTDIPGALALANGAQVTSNQLLAKGGDNWEVISTMIAGYITQLKVMVPGTGALNQALNALNVTQSQQVTNAQKVASAYQSWLGIVTGGDSAFTTFEQGQSTLTDTLDKNSAANVKMTDTSGKLKEQISLVGASMNGTTDAALAARQAFDSQVTAAATLYANLQTMSVVSGSTTTAQQHLASAGKDLVAQMLPLAHGSKEATAEVYALAQIAGYQGPDSFQKLTQWVGNTKGAEADLDKQQIALTLSSANLTQAAKNLSSAMANEVSAGEAAAITKSTDLKNIQDNLATAVINAGGKIDAQSTQLAGQYYQALLKAGNSTKDATDDVDAFLQKMGATPATVATVNNALAKLPKTVNIDFNANVAGAEANVNTFAGLVNAIPKNVAVQLTASVAGANLNQIATALTGQAAGGIVGAAGGMTVRGGGPSGKDSQLVLAAPGELIIPTSHAPAFRDQARKASIPGFADGGLPVPHFDAGGLSGTPVFNNTGVPYSYATQTATADITVSNSGNQGLPGATQLGQNTTNQLLQTLIKLSQMQPQNLAIALTNTSAQGVRRGWFATAG